MKFITRVCLLLLLVPLSVFALQQACDVSSTGHNYDYAPISYLDSKSIGVAVVKADLAYSYLALGRLSCETGPICYSGLPRSIVTGAFQF